MKKNILFISAMLCIQVALHAQNENETKTLFNTHVTFPIFIGGGKVEMDKKGDNSDSNEKPYGEEFFPSCVPIMISVIEIQFLLTYRI